jgi:DNA-binding transcriptional regulator YiaG
MPITAPPAPSSIPLAYADRVQPEPVPATEFRAWRERLGLSQEALAHELGVTSTTVYRWEHGDREIQPMVRRAMRDVERELKRRRP